MEKEKSVLDLEKSQVRHAGIRNERRLGLDFLLVQSDPEVSVFGALEKANV